MFQSFAIILALAAVFSYLNHKWLKLPSTIGLMVLSLVFGMLIFASSTLHLGAFDFLCQTITDADFKTVLLDFMLSFLLFAGAMHVNARNLAREKWTVILFASIGVLLSTLLVGFFLYIGCAIINLEIPLLVCFLFGAIVSPTDPIAVLGILKTANVSESLSIKIEGESLFNDGIGVVVFLGLLSLLDMQGQGHDYTVLFEIFAHEALGGLAFGIVLGFLGFLILKSIDDDPKICVLITLAIVMGGYSLASFLGVSGPLAMVVSGLWIGNRMHASGFSRETDEFVEVFWEMLDETLNAVLFVMIGLVVHTIHFENYYFGLGAYAILIALLARFISVGSLFSLIRHKNDPWLPLSTVLSWGGLRGGISVALALSLPPLLYRDELLFMTYAIVVFSIIVQGLSLGPLVRALRLSQSS